METSRGHSSTTGSGDGNRKKEEITPAYCCTAYFCFILVSIFLVLFSIGLAKFGGDRRCYLELYANSVSVSNSITNANVSIADWSFGFVATSPVTGCKISLYSIKSRLLRGQEAIPESSSSMDSSGRFAASYEPDWEVQNLDFNKVVTPEVIGDVVWDIQVKIVAGMNSYAKFGSGRSIRLFREAYFLVVCRDIPVKFTADSTGNKIGSLLGNMRRCDYETVDNLDNSDYWYYTN